MIKRFFRVVLVLIGLFGGLALGKFFNLYLLSGVFDKLSQTSVPIIRIVVCALFSGIIGLIFFVFSRGITEWFSKRIAAIERRLSQMPFFELLLCVVGLVIGLVIAYLLSRLALSIPGIYLPLIVNLCSYVTFASLGITIAYKRKNEVELPSWLRRGKGKNKSNSESNASMTSGKILDTSAIIDGRIYDILKTGFIEGTLIIPCFVLSELRHVADNSDQNKRQRGRRGLEILEKIQQEGRFSVKYSDTDYDDITEVDEKLLRLASELSASIITMDYNLNKVAKVQKVAVLNINDLANSIKSVFLPGEEIRASITKEGKEYGQGLAYLSDGTMIVVENGRNFVGETVLLCVTSTLQTSAGRMIFAKVVEEDQVGM